MTEANPNTEKFQTDTVYTINPKEVIVYSRQRTRPRDKKEYEDFKSSISKFGQLQPGVCRKDKEDNTVLIIGEGRLNACVDLDIPYRYILKEDVKSEADLYEIELIENIRRENLHFTDRCEAFLRLHELRQEEKGHTRPGARGGHGIRDTAEELHFSVGSVAEDIKIAMFAREIPEVKAAVNRSTARKIIERLEGEYTREEALDEAIKTAEEAEEATITATTTIEEGETNSTVESVAATDRRILEYDKRCILGKMEEALPNLEAGPFDVVCFDPPWGVNFDTVSKNHGGTKMYSDEAEKIKAVLPVWLRLIYSHMAENAHLYLFFGIVNHGLVYSILEDLRTEEEKADKVKPYGFETNRMPIFWHKKGSHRTRNPRVWPGRSYEAIAYARKGSKTLAVYGKPDIATTPMLTPKMKLNHPSAKHPDIYKDLLTRSCAPGDKVLDPMAGSGMFGVAAEDLRRVLALDWWQIEVELDFKVTQIWNLQLGYHGVLDDKVETPITSPGSQVEHIIPDLPGDFHSLTPGTEDWLRFWKANPDKQKEMIAWNKRLQEEQKIQ